MQKAGLIALAEAVEIGFGRVALQSAEYHEFRNRGIPQSHTAPQGFFHRLLVVHLTVADRLVALAIAFTVLSASQILFRRSYVA